MKKNVYIFLFLFPLFCSCGNDSGGNPITLPPSGAFFSKSFIQAYVFPEEAVAYNSTDRYISVEFRGREVIIGRMAHEEEFEELSEKYNDTDFNHDLIPYTNVSSACKYSGIDVTCDKDLDSAHPAGSSLNDLINLGAISFKEFIASRYNRDMKVPEWPKELDQISVSRMLGYYPLYKPLRELMPNDLVLIDRTWYLHLVGIPSGTYRFTITVKFADGGEPLVSTLETTVQ